MALVTLWDRDHLRIDISHQADCGVGFDVQDLDPPETFGDEYAYRFAIAVEDVPPSRKLWAARQDAMSWSCSRRMPRRS